MIDRHHRGTISFEHSANVKNSPAGMSKMVVTNLINELNTNDLVLKNPDLLERYEDMLLSALLYLPHKDREKIYERS